MPIEQANAKTLCWTYLEAVGCTCGTVIPPLGRAPTFRGGLHPPPSNRDLRGSTDLQEVYIHVLMLLKFTYCFLLQAGEMCFSIFNVNNFYLRSSLLQTNWLLNLIITDLHSMIKFISSNVNGLLSPIKQLKILTKLKRENIDIAFLQETHMTGKDHVKLKRQGFKHVFASSNGSKHTRGVAILISGRLTYEHICTVSDKEGRFIMLKGRVDGNLFTLYNAYIPPGSEPDFYVRILDKIATETQGALICGGDFNITLNPRLDSSGTRTSQNQKITKKIDSMMLEMGLIDV